jgi:hypothetical protein
MTPDRSRTVSVRKDDLMTVIGEFYDEHIFDPGRAALLASHLAAGAAQEGARAEKKAAALRTRVDRKDTHQVTIHVTLTDSTPDTLARIIARSEPSAPASSDLPTSPIGAMICTADAGGAAPGGLRQVRGAGADGRCRRG